MGERGSQIPRLHHGGCDADDTCFQYELFACGQCVFGDDYVLGGGCTSLQTLVEGCRSRYDSFGGKKKLLGSRRFCAKLHGLSALAYGCGRGGVATLLCLSAKATRQVWLDGSVCGCARGGCCPVCF